MIQASFAPENWHLEPLRHFRIEVHLPLQLAGVDLSISNAVVWMWIGSAAVFLLLYIATRRMQPHPDRLQLVAEIVYRFIDRMAQNNIGREASRFVPMLFTLFCFIIGCNLIGLIPGAFTPTSQIVVTGTLAVGIFAYTVWLRIDRHGWRFFRAFAPPGVPAFLLPLMIPIELLSFLARPVSLAVRLFANMTAGHTVLGVIAFFGLLMPWFAAWLPLGLSVILLAIEIFIAGIQAYIFTILSCVYIDDALHDAEEPIGA
jgi:F-type H+-transporting ATPase subunit a